ERAAGAVALGRLGPDPTSVAALSSLVSDSQAGVRTAAVVALERTQTPAARAAVRAALSDDKLSVRLAATRALGFQRTNESVETLIGALKRSRGRLEAELLASLRRLTGANLGEQARDWLAWWEAVRETYVLPDPNAKPPKGAKRLKTRPRARPGYWGASVVSERVAFLVDTSGSMIAERRMQGSTVVVTRMIVAREELRRVIGELPGRARFNVIPFASLPQPWKRKSQRATKKNKAKATSFVGELRARGGTNIHDALMLALADPQIDTIWLLTDGEPTLGQVVDPTELLREVRLKNATRRVAIHTLGVGLKSAFLARLAAENQGRHYLR
ncbi:MAG: HEAT repeat domain-containing protein, partial [Planctomycetes bacterium]|nr:HEAT repeat domain-containing protein [Planctomycetota bacterium]